MTTEPAKYCPSCGVKLLEGATFCHGCGKPLTSATKPISKGFPGALWLLPIFLGIIGGIIASIIAGTVYHAKWWPLLVGGIMLTIIWYIVYFFIMVGLLGLHIF